MKCLRLTGDDQCVCGLHQRMARESKRLRLTFDVGELARRVEGRVAGNQNAQRYRDSSSST